MITQSFKYSIAYRVKKESWRKKKAGKQRLGSKNPKFLT